MNGPIVSLRVYKASHL